MIYEMHANKVVIAMFGYDKRMSRLLSRLLHVLLADRDVIELVFEDGWFVCKGLFLELDIAREFYSFCFVFGMWHRIAK